MPNQMVLLEHCIDCFKKEYNLEQPISDIFELFTAVHYLDKYEFTFEDIEKGIMDSAHDGGIDGFYIFVNGEILNEIEELSVIKLQKTSHVEVVFIQSKYEKSFKEDVLNKFYIILPTLFDLEMSDDDRCQRISSEMVEKIKVFHEVWKLAMMKHSKVSIRYVYSNRAELVETNGVFNNKVEQIINTTKQYMPKAEVVFVPLDACKLVELYQTPETEQLVLKFRDNPMPIDFNDDELGYLGVVELTEYYKFVTDGTRKIRESLFESNIRHYQGSVTVNDGIRKTLDNGNEKQHDFWWLNNGVTIIASNCNVRAKELTIDDVQIVNGLQTTFTICRYFEDNPEKLNACDMRSVLVKVIQTKEKTTFDKIISASNSQTAVPLDMLKATEKVHRDIEIFFESKGFYYDRRKNFYKNNKRPLNRIIGMKELAQMYEAYVNGKPNTSRSSPKELYKDDSRYNSVFSEEIPLETYYYCVEMNNVIKNFIKTGFKQNERRFVKNFSYHLGRVITAELAGGVNKVTLITLSKVDIQTLNRIVEESWKYLSSLYELYCEKSPGVQLESIAKSKGFGDFLDENLKIKFHK